MQDAGRVAEIVDILYELIESKQAGADLAMVSFISTAGEIALSLIASKTEFRDACLKTHSCPVEQVRNKLRHELRARGI